jgi:acyl carrier protein phosphodiesterase
MNWLAHVYLSPPDVEFRLGNLLADLVKRNERTGLPPAFLAGIEQHQAIDSFTDFHPVVHRSRGRISSNYRRFAGILVDVFYDHFLATDWDQYASEPLSEFTTKLYAEVRVRSSELPEEAQQAMQRLIAGDILGSYRTIAGIEASLRRVSIRLESRIGRDMQLEKAIGELTTQLDGFRDDFREFFPQLRDHIREREATLALGS